MINGSDARFSKFPMSKQKLFDLLSMDNENLFDENIDFFVVHSELCYDSSEATPDEVNSFITDFFDNTEKKYQSFYSSNWKDLFMLFFRPTCLEKEDFDLVREAITYFDTPRIYLGYVLKGSKKKYNLP